MEIKKILAAVLTVGAVAACAASAYAADDVIYESGRTEATSEAVDLDGWGEELFTKAIFEADVQFKAPDAGITLRSADNKKGGTSIRAVMRNDVLTMAAYGGVEGNYIYYNPVDTNATYHIKLIGTYGTANGIIDMVAETLGENGEVTETKEAYLILMNEMYASSGVGPEHIRVEPNTVVDNVKVTVLKPDVIEFVSPPQTVTAASATQLQTRFLREGEPLEYDAPVEYSVSSWTNVAAEQQVALKSAAEISDDGVLTVSNSANEGDSVTVTAKSGGMSAETTITVASSDIFTLNTALMSEDGKTLEAVNAVKNYFVNGNAVFAVAVYDDAGTLKGCFTKSVPAKSVPLKTATDINLGYTLPEEFDPDTWTIEIYAWSDSAPCDVPEVYENEIAVRKFFEDNGGAVEWLGEHETVAGMLNGHTALMQTGSEIVYVDGERYTLPIAVYIDDAWTTRAHSKLVGLMR